MYDLIIKNANIVDGTLRKSFNADIAILEDTIVRRGKNLGKAKYYYDAQGLTLCPGIIDIHTHYDAQLTWDPKALPSLDLGVTTAIIGNCGFTIAPCRVEDRDLNMRNLQKVEGMSYEALKKGIDWSFNTYQEYLRLLESKKLFLNVCSFIGHSALRIWCMGEDAMQREANENEILKMEKLVKKAMESGAIGFATSTFEGHNGANGVPMPSRFASQNEIIRLIEAMASQGRGIFMITKSNNDNIKDITELLGSSNRPAMVAPILFNPTKKNWAINTLDDINEMKEKGFEIWGQVSCRPLTMEFTMQEPYMLEGLNTWKKVMKAARQEEVINIFRDIKFRESLLNEINDKKKNKLFVGNWDKITLINSKNKNIQKFMGFSLEHISKLSGKRPLDWILDNAINGGMNDLFKAELLNANVKEVKKLLLHQNSTIALSDAGAHQSLLCDAGYGLDLLGKWVREYKIMSIEEAIYSLTAKQADICRIPKRGRLVPGHYADMILFDPNSIGISNSFRVGDLPDGSSRLSVKSKGIKKIWINGVPYDGKNSPNGRVIKSFLS